MDRTPTLLDDADSLLARLLDAAGGGGRHGAVIEILVLQALSRQLRGNDAAALDALDRALVLAEPEGNVRVFLDEGQPIIELLKDVAVAGRTPEFLRTLLEACGREPVEPTRRAAESLVEPLSDREREVLRLLATDLSGPEIARRLVLSLHTVRTHQDVYAKLGVNSRRAAVRRAEELGL